MDDVENDGVDEVNNECESKVDGEVGNGVVDDVDNVNDTGLEQPSIGLVNLASAATSNFIFRKLSINAGRMCSRESSELQGPLKAQLQLLA